MKTLAKSRKDGTEKEKTKYLEEFEEVATGRVASEEFTRVWDKEKIKSLMFQVQNPDFPTQRLRVSHLIQRLQNVLQKEGDLPIKTYDQEEDGELTTLWAYDVEIFEGAVIIS